MSANIRDKLRTALFSAVPKSILVPVGEDTIEVRQPQVGDMLDSMAGDSQRHRIARMLINSCYVPGTSERVFEEADFDMLMSMPAGGMYADLMDAITKNIDLKKATTDEKKPSVSSP
jgi:hypothetical protein